WIKLKDTSFYSFKSLTNLIPASASSYDSDDNNASHFIIADPGYDPGPVSASSFSLGFGSASSHNRHTTAASNASGLSQVPSSPTSMQALTTLGKYLPHTSIGAGAALAATQILPTLATEHFFRKCYPHT
ncbi:MAG: hypothetical protein RMJ60_08085, partial [Anaerolineales bacterium]|nr:hypothetical protein [Anaerolineales bacterium]